MPTCVVVSVIVSCLIDPATRPTPEEAARILAASPGPSNRTHVDTRTFEEKGRVIFVPTAPSAPKPIEPRRLDGSPLSEPPAVYGIPYPWTPLTWAILHSGAPK